MTLMSPIGRRFLQQLPKAGCPRLDSLSGNITEGFTEFPVYEEGKWNPCYYTKAFAGLGELYSDKMRFKSVHRCV